MFGISRARRHAAADQRQVRHSTSGVRCGRPSRTERPHRPVRGRRPPSRVGLHRLGLTGSDGRGRTARGRSEGSDRAGSGVGMRRRGGISGRHGGNAGDRREPGRGRRGRRAGHVLRRAGTRADRVALGRRREPDAEVDVGLGDLRVARADVPTGSPSATAAPAATANEPRCVSVTAYPSAVVIVRLRARRRARCR